MQLWMVKIMIHKFFIELHKCLGLDKGNGVTFISYVHHAIINVMANVLPHAKHRHYDRHIFFPIVRSLNFLYYKILVTYLHSW